MADIRTKEDYEEYEARVAHYLQGLSFISAGLCAGCETCRREYDFGEDDEPPQIDAWFSWTPCEICNHPTGGNREHWHAIADKDTPDETIVHGDCCEDCAYYLNMGRLDDTTMQRIGGER